MAEPEADAQQFLYNTYGYNYHYPYNYGYHPYTPYTYHYAKREAEAEPEADPALIYTSTVHHSPLVSPLVSTTGVHQPIIYSSAVPTPVVYKTVTGAEKTEKVSTPVVYTHALPLQTPLVYKFAHVYNTALTTPVLSKVFPTLETLTT